MNVAQTLGTVHGLVGNVRLAMEGKQHQRDFVFDIYLSAYCIRQQGLYTFVIPLFYLSLRRPTVLCR